MTQLFQGNLTRIKDDNFLFTAKFLMIIIIDKLIVAVAEIVAGWANL